MWDSSIFARLQEKLDLNRTLTCTLGERYPNRRANGSKKERRMVIKSGWPLVGLLSLSVYGAGWADTVVNVPASVAAAISDPRRPAEQVRLDATRKPAMTVAFAEAKAGDRIADVMSGNGYFTRILSD